MSAEEQIYTYRVTHKVRTGGSGCLFVVCFVIGLISLFLFWPLGLLFIAIAFAVNTKTAFVSTCGNCGNQVAHSSILCPTCSADLAPEPLGKRWWRTL